MNIVLLFNKWPVPSLVESIVVLLLLSTVSAIMYMIDRAIQNKRGEKNDIRKV